MSPSRTARAPLAPSLLVLLLVLATAVGLAVSGRAYAPRRVVSLAEGEDEVTFLVAADTHLGAEGLYELNVRQVEAMNGIGGTPWPGALGGRVARPAALLVAGDLTDLGRLEEWWAFTRLYGMLPGQGMLAYPVFVGTGNHDLGLPLVHPVPGAVAFRHGHRRQVLRLGPLLVLGLDLYPDAAGLLFLRRELQRADATAPVVLWFHYPLEGPYSDWWTDEEKEAFHHAVAGRGIAAIFHGHYHRSGHALWRGIPVYDVGSPRHRDHTFAVVRWRRGRLDVAAWDWERGAWAWHDAVPAPRRPPPDTR